MGKLGYLLSGALLGAAGLTAATLLTSDRDSVGETAEQNVDFTPDDTAYMDAAEVARHLNGYYFKCSKLGIKGAVFPLGCLDLQCCSTATPYDGPLVKLGNKVSDTLMTIGRKGKEQDLRMLRQHIEELYQMYRPVFVRANRLLAVKGIAGVSLKGFSLADRNFSLNNDAANEDWDDELLTLLDVLQDFVSRTTEAADTLTSRLEKIGGGVALSPVPASITA